MEKISYKDYSDNVMIEFCQSHGFKYYTISRLNIDVTAEILCENIFKCVKSGLQERHLEAKTVDFVRIWENDGSMAEYTED